MDKEYIIVTGSRGGIGKAVSQLLQKEDYHVIGLDIAAISEDFSPNATQYQVDITNESELKAVYQEIVTYTNRIKAIINIAGIMRVGSLIEESTTYLERVLAVNVLGTYAVNHVFFPLLRVGQGRIINFSSEYGTYTTVPFNGFYTMSKHAVDSYSDGLRRELAPLGIKVSTIRPGAFKTEMENSALTAFEAFRERTTHYKAILDKMFPLLEKNTKGAKETSIIATIVLKALEAEHPKSVYKSNHNIGMKALSHLPRFLQDKIFERMVR